MKNIVSIFFACIVGTTFGQSTVEFPWNPDTNDDGIVGAEDLLGLLSIYNGEWELPDPSVWASSTIISLVEFESDLIDYEAELSDLSDSLAQVQDELDSVQLEIEACDRGEGLYNCAQLYPGNDVVQYLPEDCGTVWTLHYGGGWSRTIRLPPNALSNTSILMITEIQAGVSSQLRVEWMQNGVWSLLFSYGYHPYGTMKYDILKYDGTSWSRESASQTSVPFD